jgi:hypothetical protein
MPSLAKSCLHNSGAQTEAGCDIRHVTWMLRRRVKIAKTHFGKLFKQNLLQCIAGSWNANSDFCTTEGRLHLVTAELLLLYPPLPMAAFVCLPSWGKNKTASSLIKSKWRDNSTETVSKRPPSLQLYSQSTMPVPWNLCVSTNSSDSLQLYWRSLKQK